ncbi:MAG: glycoside hydrolase family 32 protein, partial [Anaerolineae bacterium]|nr:glycoside hydrolase family 32 protein [Anaerolineae bacterium]
MTRTEFTRDARQKLAGDLHRPIYHYQPPYNWMNDPNGLIHWKGEYHLFYQHNPDSPLHANMHWGHAVSPDLVHWEDLPIALAPTPGGPDKDGVWSGCAVNGDGVPTIFYTGVFPECQLVVRASDDMRSFEKYAGNPVIAAPPSGLNVTGFRDPFVWKEADGWYMVVGSGIKGVGGTVFLYRSPDLLYWEYIHPLLMGSKDETGVMWECPGFFNLGDKWVLYVSITPLAYV